MKVSQIKAGALLSYIALFLNVIISLFYTPYMLRMLGKSEFGLFSLVNSTIAYLTILDFGFGNAVIRYTAKFRAEQNIEKERSLNGMFLIIYFAIGMIAFLLGLILLDNVHGLFGKSLTESELGTANVLMWLAVINIALAFPFSIFSSIIQAYERFILFQSVNMIRLVITPLLMVSVLTLGYRSIGIIAATTILNLTFNIFNLCYCLFGLKSKFKFGDYDFSLLKEIAVYSSYIFLGLIVDRIYWSTGQFLLGIYTGAAAVSVFSIGLQINTYYTQISTSISGVFLPRITTMATKSSDVDQLSDLFIRVGRIQFFILAMALGGFLVLGKFFIAMWAGAGYQESYYIALLLLFPITIPLIQNLGITILQAKNRMAFRSVVYLLIALVNIMITISLIKLWGPIGSALGTAVALVVGQIVIMNIYYYKRIKLDIPVFWMEIAKMVPAVIIPTALEYCFTLIYPVSGIPVFLMHAVLFVVMYGFSMWRFGLNQSEKELVLTPVRKILGRVYSLDYY